MKDLRTEIKSWYVIQGDEHLKIGSFQDAIKLMETRAHNHPGQQLLMMSDKEYSTWGKRKSKRGKKS